MVVVVSDLLGQYLLEMSAPEDEEPVGALSADSDHESLGECVRSWRSNGCLDEPNVFGAEDLVETGSELRISAPDQTLGCSEALGEVRSEVASLLNDPLPGRVGSDPGICQAI